MGWCFAESAKRSQTTNVSEEYRAPEGASTVVVPEGVKEISWQAFELCEDVVSVDISKSVSRIPFNPFTRLHKLSSITVAKGNKFYDSRDNCNALINKREKELIAGCMNTVIPDSVEGIGEDAFQGCIELRTIIIPKSILSIGEDAFYGCSSLVHIRIPESVEWISGNAFKWCTSLKKISVSKRNKVFDSRNDCNAIIQKKTDTLLCGCQKTIIPDTVKIIGKKAFEGCEELKTIVIPNSVKKIDSDAFKDCTGLTSIIIPDSVEEISESAFANCTSLTSISIPHSVQRIMRDAFAGCTSLISVDLHDFHGEIGQGAFRECTGLKSIILPSTVKSIGSALLMHCSSLTEVIIPKAVEMGHSLGLVHKNLEDFIFNENHTQLGFTMEENHNFIILTKV